MAGYVINPEIGYVEFHTDTPNVVEKIKQASMQSRVVTMQLDCDELDAALWGLENYRKNELPLGTDDNSTALRTIITFSDGKKNDQRVHLYDEVLPNIAVGQSFVYDHKDVKLYQNGRITNIKHVMSQGGSYLTYVDVSVSYPM